MAGKKQSTPWWAVAQLWGLEAPLVAFFWSVAFSATLGVFSVPMAAYFFLFVSVWVVGMLLRLIRVFGSPSQALLDWRYPFYRDHFIPLSCLTLAMVAAGVWIGLFQVGVGLLGYCSLPFIFGCLYAILGPAQGELARNFRVLLGSLSFSFGCLVPSWFYVVSMGWDRFLVYKPCYTLAILLFLHMQFRRYWVKRREDGDHDSSDLALNLLLLAYLIYTLVVANSLTAQEQWFYYALAVGSGLLQMLDRFRSRLSHEALISMSWAALALPAVCVYLLSL